jgi:SAM-dependent methyltransferase
MSEWSRETILQKYQQAAERSKPYSWFNYQPINLPGYEATLSLCGRKCFDRSRAVEEHLASVFGNRRISIIDWGCNLGFFCFELAKLGHRVIGVDNNLTNVEICRYLARTNDFDVRPQFFCDELSTESLPNYHEYDVALCFSVLHHLKDRKIATLNELSRTYPYAYIEMDGSGYGFNTLYAFYWNLEEVVETNDPYGSGHRKRKTWFCSNHLQGKGYQNIKDRNIVGSRGVFKVQRGESATVVKRELKFCRSHTWVDTSLLHERDMYHRFNGVRFFPRLIGHDTSADSHWIELEYICEDRSFSERELLEFYRFLRENRLFILDLTYDSFLFSEGRLKVVDLETMFPVEESLENLVQARSPKRSLPFGSYEEQLQYLIQRLNS